MWRQNPPKKALGNWEGAGTAGSARNQAKKPMDAGKEMWRRNRPETPQKRAETLGRCWDDRIGQNEAKKPIGYWERDVEAAQAQNGAEIARIAEKDLWRQNRTETVPKRAGLLKKTCRGGTAQKQTEKGAKY